MEINKASDLHFTHVQNTPELRAALIAKCAKFDIGVFAFSPDERYLEVYAASGDIFEICGTHTLEESSKELTIEDLALEEKPSEKVEWDGEGLPPVGFECEMKYKHASKADWRACKVFAYSNEMGVVAAIWHWTDYMWKHATIDVNGYEFRGIETPQQREEREKLEAAYDLYLDFYQDYNPCHDTIESFDCSRDKDLWLRTVDKTNYRKGVK